MKRMHRVLIAAQPGAWRVLQSMLDEVTDLVSAHTSADAYRILERERIDLVISTIAFDDSRMIDFLQAAKTIAVRQIPFLCVRVFPSVLSDNLVGALRDACKECGAVDLIDLAKLTPDRAQTKLRAAVVDLLRT
jgi:hypothetical protein